MKRGADRSRRPKTDMTTPSVGRPGYFPDSNGDHVGSDA